MVLLTFEFHEQQEEDTLFQMTFSFTQHSCDYHVLYQSNTVNILIHSSPLLTTFIVFTQSTKDHLGYF